jgi:thioredoxin reductase (NADPH)
MANSKVEVIWNSEVVDVLGEKQVSAIQVKNIKSGDVTEMPMDGVFVAIGHKPNTKVFEGQLATNDVGYLLTEGKSSYTSVPGVFAAGDVQDFTYRQAVTAAGTGCMAAIDCERWLEKNAHT